LFQQFAFEFVTGRVRSVTSDAEIVYLFITNQFHVVHLTAHVRTCGFPLFSNEAAIV